MSASVAFSGKSRPRSTIPASAQAFFFIRTYVALSGLDPTRTTARPGARPLVDFKSSTRRFNSSRIVSAVALPSIIVTPVASADVCIIVEGGDDKEEEIIDGERGEGEEREEGEGKEREDRKGGLLKNRSDLFETTKSL